MPRTQKAVAVVCLTVVLFAALLPAALSNLGCAILTPLWLVLPAVTVVVIRRTAFRCDERPVSLLALVLSRAPPTTALA